MHDFTLIPFENITKFGQKTMLDQPLFNVSWILGRFCNYSCSYCWPYANSNVPDHQDFDVYTNAIEWFDLVCEKHQKILKEDL